MRAGRHWGPRVCTWAVVSVRAFGGRSSRGGEGQQWGWGLTERNRWACGDGGTWQVAVGRGYGCGVATALVNLVPNK